MGDWLRYALLKVRREERNRGKFKPRRKINAGDALYLAAIIAASGARAALASNLDTIGLTQLLAIEPNLTGSGVIVGQAEADVGPNEFAVNPGTVGQPASLFTYFDDNGVESTTFNAADESTHADNVGAYFYGTTGSGVATGVAHVDNYSANYFAGTLIPNLTAVPDKVVNQSFVYIEDSTTPLTVADQESTDTIYDNYIAMFGTIIVSAVGNGAPFTSVNAPGTAYNGIGVSAYPGPVSVGPTPDNGRSKPDITAPGNFTSYTTPLVAGSAAILYQAGAAGDGGATPQLETDADDSRTIKALLLNGAAKQTIPFNRTHLAPLDRINGAGMLNVYNSFQQLAAGQHSASSVLNTTTLGGAHPVNTSGGLITSPAGWDFASLTTTPITDACANYALSSPGGTGTFTMTATVVWNRPFNSNANTNIGINNLDLFLYDATTGTRIDYSNSVVDNVQTVYDTGLNPADKYDLQVLKNGGIAGTTGGVITNSETYALAFNIATPLQTIFNGGGSNSWGDATNWSGGVPQTAMQTATFSGANPSPTTINLNGSWTVGNINFDNTKSYTIATGSGGALGLDNGVGLAYVSDSLGSHTITAPIVLNSGTVFSVYNPGDTLSLLGEVTGSYGLTVAGNGTVVFGADNLYAGGTYINGGTLRITSGATIGSAFSQVTVTQGALLDLNGNGEFIAGLNGGGTIDDVAGGESANLSVGNANGSGTFTGVIQNTTGTISLIKTGTGIQSLSGSNTYTGGTHINQGTLAIANGSSVNSGVGGVQFGSGAELEFTGSTALISALGGAGQTITLGAASGVTTALSTILNGSALDIVGPGTLSFTGTNNTGSLSLNAGEFGVSNTSGLPTGIPVIFAGGILGIAGNLIQNLNAYNVNYSSFNGGLDIQSASNVFTIANSIGGTSLSMTGAGTLVLTASNTYSVATTINGGTVRLSGSGTLGSTSSTLAVNSPGVLDLNGTSQSVGALWGGGIIDNIAGGGSVILSLGNGDTTGTYTGVIQNTSGTISLVKTGVGSQTLGGSSTYSGSTTVSGGTLAIGAAGALPAGGTVVNNATLSILAGTSAQPVVAGNLSGNGTLSVGNISTVGFLQIATSAGISQPVVTIATGSTLDITNNTLTINYGLRADPANTIRQYLTTAYKGGTWAGPGLTSSLAAAKPSAFSVGYQDNTSTEQVIVKLTVPGDASLDGQTDFTDLTIVAQFFGSSIAKNPNLGWSQGDVNYSGTVDFNDLTIVAQYFGDSLTKAEAALLPASFVAQYDLALAEDGVHAGSTSVPEPGTIGLIAVCAGGSLLRRRWRTRAHAK